MIKLKSFNLSKPLATFGMLLIGLMIVGNQSHTHEIPTMTLKEYVKTLKIKVDPRQITCMARNIFYEAGNESLIGQAAVARVVMNRIKHGFGASPCSVIYQKATISKVNSSGEEEQVNMCQFSWVCTEKASSDVNNPKFKQAIRIAREVLEYDAYTDVVPKTALFFHNTQVEPNWPYAKVATIGNHVFYSKPKNKQKS